MTATKITVIPAPGLLVMNPATGQPLPSSQERPAGTKVPLSSYWHKRVACGDAINITAAEAAPAAPKADEPATSDDAVSDSPTNTSASLEAPPTAKHSKPKDR